MHDFFKKLLEKYNLSDEQVNNFAASFSVLILMTLLHEAKDKFSENEQKTCQDAIRRSDFKQVDSLVISKFSASELGELVETHILPLFKEYREQVLRDKDVA